MILKQQLAAILKQQLAATDAYFEKDDDLLYCNFGRFKLTPNGTNV